MTDIHNDPILRKILAEIARNHRAMITISPVVDCGGLTMTAGAFHSANGFLLDRPGFGKICLFRDVRDLVAVLMILTEIRPRDLWLDTKGFRRVDGTTLDELRDDLASYISTGLTPHGPADEARLREVLAVLDQTRSQHGRLACLARLARLSDNPNVTLLISPE
jgi:hypothetical protein